MKQIELAGPLPERDSLMESALTTIDEAHELVQISEAIEREDQENQRTAALSFARAMALAMLPASPTKERQVSREIKLGKDLEYEVIYTSAGQSQMPFGADRLVLAGIQHLAIQQRSPRVRFKEVGELLGLFNLSGGGKQYNELRRRLDRLKGLVVDIVPKKGSGPFGTGGQGEGFRVIKRWHLPTARELKARKAGQLTLDGQEDAGLFFVDISDDLYNYLTMRDGRVLMLVRLDLQSRFVNKPTAWDYLTFLVHRCGSAKSESRVPHDDLMKMFKCGSESDSKTIEKLRRYHKQIMIATSHRLNAELVQAGKGRRSKRGPLTQLWDLQVGPSRAIIFPTRSATKQLRS